MTPFAKGVAMAKLDERSIANMEVVLEDVFKAHPHGGDHESRKHVARKLLQVAKRGHATLRYLSRTVRRKTS